MWYETDYRRHLADMHIEDWNEEFLSEFSPEQYVDDLKTARVTNAMIYLQSHVGLCYFPTKVGVMHKSFVGKEDTVKRLIDLCHKEGIAVTGYYSLIYNTREHDRHPEWRMVKADGFSVREKNGNASDTQKLDFASAKQARYGLCCPNSLEYREFVYKQIDEMLEYFTVEGMFFDMPFWNHTCYCKKCRKRFKEELGYEMPESPKTDREYKDILARKYAWMGEFIQSVTEYVKKKDPKLSVEHNFASGIAGDSNNGCGEEVANACDFLGGDLYGGIINHSLACKFYKNITPNAPFDYMFSRCKPALRSHTLTKTEDEMKAEIMLTAAHHGATMVIDAIDPIGTFDKRVYKTIGNVFGLQERYEKYFTGEMVEDIGLYYSIKSRYNNRGEEYQNKVAAISVSQTLIERHIPFGVTGNFHSLESYKMIILPLLTEFDSHDTERICSYVKNGGNVYMSGAENPELLERLTGACVTGRTEEKNVYIAPTALGKSYFFDFNEKYPLPFDGTAPTVKAAKESEIFATLTLPYTSPRELRFASIHSDPPGASTDIPAVIRTKLGKGNIIWSALPLEAETVYEYREIFMRLLLSLMPDYKPSFVSDAPNDVELTLFDADGFMTVNAAVVEERAVSKLYPSFSISVKTEKAPEAVKLLPDETDIPFVYENGYATFKTRELDIFDMYKIEK